MGSTITATVSSAAATSSPTTTVSSLMTPVKSSAETGSQASETTYLCGPWRRRKATRIIAHVIEISSTACATSSMMGTGMPVGPSGQMHAVNADTEKAVTLRVRPP